MYKKIKLYSLTLLIVMLMSLSGQAQHIIKLDTDTFYIINILKMINSAERGKDNYYFMDTAYFVVLKNNEEIEKKLKCGRLDRRPFKLSQNSQKKKIQTMFNIIQKYYVANYIIEPFSQNPHLSLSLYDRGYYDGILDTNIINQLSLLGMDSLAKEKTQVSSSFTMMEDYTMMPKGFYPPSNYYYLMRKVKMTYIAIKDERDLYKGQLCFSCSRNMAILSSIPGTDSTVVINAIQLEILPPIRKITNKLLQGFPPGYLERFLPIQRHKEAKK